MKLAHIIYEYDLLLTIDGKEQNMLEAYLKANPSLTLKDLEDGEHDAPIHRLIFSIMKQEGVTHVSNSEDYDLEPVALVDWEQANSR